MKDDKNTSGQEKHTLLSENLFAVFNKLVQSVRIHDRKSTRQYSSHSQ